METILLIIIIIMALFVLKMAIKLNRLEEKTLGAFRIICDDVKTNRERINACISRFAHEERPE